MNKLLSGKIYDNEYIDVVNLHGKGMISQEVRPSKVIVGISITLINEAFKPSHLVFPAVLDTGFNKAFEIDERHLKFWNGTPKENFPAIGRRIRTAPGVPSYDIREARIWLHLEPYSGPRFQGNLMPYPLYVSDEIRIVDGLVSEPQPRFPLLGMDAIIQNKLLLFIDGRPSTFEIYE